MTLTIPITPEIEAKLRERAAEFGRDVAEYAADLIRQGVSNRTFDELLAPIREDFARTGMSDDEIMEFGRRELEAIRAEKNTKSQS